MEGALLAGADEVLVADGHGSTAIDPLLLHPAARLLSPCTGYPFGLDQGPFDCALIIGQHAKAGTLDGHLVIDNDGLHSAKGLAAFVRLKRGEHRIRLSYFQGPRDEVALILAVIPPGEDEFSLFNTEDYLSPKALAEWKKSKPDDPQFSLNPRPRRKPAQDFEMAPSIPVHE